MLTLALPLFLAPLALSAGIRTSSRALAIAIHPEAVELRTLVTRFTPGDQSGRVVDLYSMVHVADLSYYEELERKMSDYDYVLVELITSKKNIIAEEMGLRRLKTSVFSPTVNKIGIFILTILKDTQC